MRNLPPVTKNLLIINLICFMAALVFEQRGVDLTRVCGLHFVLSSDFGLWQPVTYMFLHANFSHLFFNMFSLWMFGRIVEQAMGEKRFIIFYFVCGIGAALCQELWQLGEYFIAVGNGSYAGLPLVEIDGRWNLLDFANQSRYLLTECIAPTIGASGACYGVLLAFGMTYPNERIMLLLPPIPLKAKYFVCGYAVIELISAFASDGNVAHFAHLGGMLFGLLLILYWRGKGRNRFEGWQTWTPRRSASPWTRLKDRFKQWFKASKPKKKDSARFSDRSADYDYNARHAEEKKRKDQEEIDRILQKIKQSGYQSLTDAERRRLFEDSKR